MRMIEIAVPGHRGPRDRALTEPSMLGALVVWRLLRGAAPRDTVVSIAPPSPDSLVRAYFHLHRGFNTVTGSRQYSFWSAGLVAAEWVQAAPAVTDGARRGNHLSVRCGDPQAIADPSRGSSVRSERCSEVS